MGKLNISYFLTAIVLVLFIQLVVTIFYDQLRPYSTKKKDSYSTYDNKSKTGGVSEKKESKEQPKDTVTKKETVKSEPADSNTPKETEVVKDEPPVNENNSSVTENASSSSLTGRAYFQDLINSYLNPILAELPEGRSREDVVVRYYRHPEDEDKVYQLRRLGYYLHEREAEDSKGFGSNVLYYGSDVDIRDIQIVAYTLIENGVPIKSIVESQYDWKYNSIEIGADSLLTNNPTLNMADIQSFSFD